MLSKSLKLSWEDIQKLFQYQVLLLDHLYLILKKFGLAPLLNPSSVFKQESNLEQRLDLTKSGSTTLNDLDHWIL